MKKILALSLIIVFFTSCIKKVPPDEPELTITPDTNIIISAISPITLKITGFGNEELKRFSIGTNPYFFSMDTTFGTFVHSFDYETELRVPAVFPTLGPDSLVAVKFTLSDGFSKIKKEVYLKVISGFKNLTMDTATTYFKRDSAMFYSTTLRREMYFSEHHDSPADFVMLYDTTCGFVIASPDAYFATKKFTKLSQTYISNNKNHTKINKITTALENITPRFLYYLNITESFIQNNSTNGIGIDELKNGDMLAFECENGIKGIIVVKKAVPHKKSLEFYVKYQIL